MYNDKKKILLNLMSKDLMKLSHNYHFHFQNTALNIGAVLSDSIVTAHKV